MINLQALLDAGIDAEVSGKVAAAMALDAAADAVVLKAKDDAYAALQAAFDAYKASHPDTVPPVIPPVDPTPPSGAPSVAAFKALTDNAGRAAYVAAAEAWFKANTGAKGTLTAYTGSRSITAAGTVIENKIITGQLRVTGANVIIRNCKITSSDYWVIDAEGAKDFSLIDCTIVGPGFSGVTQGVLAQGTFLRNDMSGCMHAIVLKDGKSVVKGNYLHNGGAGGNDPHIGGVSIKGGQNGVLVEGNFIVGKDTSDVFIQNNFGSINDVTVNENWMLGKAENGFPLPSYPQYVEGRFKPYTTTNIKVTNNVMQKGGYGYFSVVDATPVISGNVDYATGANVDAK